MNPARARVVAYSLLLTALSLGCGDDSSGPPAPPLPSITVTSPNGGETLYRRPGGVFEITWTSTGVPGNVYIRYSWGIGSSQIAFGAPNTGSFMWTVPDRDSADCHVYVGSIDTAVEDVSDAPFTITPARITVTSPNGGEVWDYGGPDREITWTSAGVGSPVDIHYQYAPWSTWTTIAEGELNDGSCIWALPDENSNFCRVRIKESGVDISDVSDGDFTITGGSWRAAARIDNGGLEDASYPVADMDANGNAVVVWQQDDGTRVNIWANRYDAATGWGSATLIENEDGGSAWSQDVAVDPAGNAIAAWQTEIGVRDHVYVNHYDVATGWGTPLHIDANDSSDAWSPRVDMDAAGNAIVVWHQQYGSLLEHVMACRYEVGSGWGVPEAIEPDGTCALNPAIAVAPGGKAIAAWQQQEPDGMDICANLYDPAAGWGTPILVRDSPMSAAPPEVAIDSNGNAIVVFHENDGSPDLNIRARRYDASSGWAPVGLLETEPGSASGPRPGIDSSGNITVVWQQDDYRYSTHAVRYSPGAGWSTAATIDDSALVNAWRPDLDVEPGGWAVAAWTQEGNAWANRYDPVSGWLRPEMVELDESGGAAYATAATCGIPSAVVAWQFWDGTRRTIWANVTK